MTLGIGIDFEHITHTPAYKSLETSPRIQIPLERITTRLLNLFDRHGVRATFFVVSEVAEQHPGLIGTIAESGHEIASHSVTHPSLPAVQSSAKRAEIRDSKQVLERITGAPITGFRAPTFQIDDEVYDLLAAEGYAYSSSLMPSIPIPGYYTNEYAFADPTQIITSKKTMVEIPLAISPWLRVPVSGAWTRLLGRTYTLASIQHLLDKERPVLTYAHPWEFTPLQNTSLPFRNRVRTGEWLFDLYDQLLGLETDYLTISELTQRYEPDHEYTVSEI